jgi:hypothetical protein
VVAVECSASGGRVVVAASLIVLAPSLRTEQEHITVAECRTAYVDYAFTPGQTCIRRLVAESPRRQLDHQSETSRGTTQEILYILYLTSNLESACLSAEMTSISHSLSIAVRHYL